jgi:hypothetical protein
MPLTAAETQLVTDGKQLAVFALLAVKGAIDQSLGYAADQTSKLTGDAFAAATDAVENLVPPNVQNFVKSVLGILTTVEAPVVASLSVSAVAALHVAQANVDLAINNLAGQILPAQSATASVKK